MLLSPDSALAGLQEASVMRKILIGIGIIGTLWASSVPASAQYRFDRRIDPSNCYWWQTCDYGGRAYRGYRWARYHYHGHRHYHHHHHHVDVVYRRWAYCGAPVVLENWGPWGNVYASRDPRCPRRPW
jgi:hypothetical protein